MKKAKQQPLANFIDYGNGGAPYLPHNFPLNPTDNEDLLMIEWGKRRIKEDIETFKQSQNILDSALMLTSHLNLTSIN